MDSAPVAAPAAPAIKPTVGRVVHFTLGDGPCKGRVRPAIIVDVHSDTCVTLDVLTAPWDADFAHQYGRSGVRQITSANLATESAEGQWHWMPYQLGQAAKTESVVPEIPDIQPLAAGIVELHSEIESLKEIVAEMADALTLLHKQVSPLIAPPAPAPAPAPERPADTAPSGGLG